MQLHAIQLKSIRFGQMPVRHLSFLSVGVDHAAAAGGGLLLRWGDGADCVTVAFLGPAAAAGGGLLDRCGVDVVVD
jgi:hypothetical protein